MYGAIYANMNTGRKIRPMADDTRCFLLSSRSRDCKRKSVGKKAIQDTVLGDENGGGLCLEETERHAIETIMTFITNQEVLGMDAATGMQDQNKTTLCQQ